MGNIDSLTELANTLDLFFKGLSECNLLTTYSLQLQATAVDSPVEGKFQLLVREFMKNLQALLLKFPHEPCEDVGYNVATRSDCTSAFIELKPAEPIISQSPPEVSYVLDQQTWEEAKLDSAAEIIVSCDSESLAAITQNNSAPESLTVITGHNSTPHELLADISEHKSTPESLSVITEHNSTPPQLLTVITGHNSPPPESTQIVVTTIEEPAEELAPEAASSSKHTPDETASPTVAAIFICELCDKTFHTSRSLSQHLSVKHRTRGQCDMCDKKFPSLQSLQEHCRSVHHGSGCFTCAVCGRRFMTRLSYSRHMDTHSGHKGAVCDICGKLLSRADYLQQHYMTHNGARPHACTTCPRRFVSAGQLKVHQRTHSGLKDHACDRCNKAFSRTDKLKEHLLRHLSIKRFTCELCERSYAEKRDLNKHMKLHVAKS